MSTPAKRKISVTIDADLVAALEAESDTTLSAEVNSALRAEFTRRRRQQALAELLDHLAEERSEPCSQRPGPARRSSLMPIRSRRRSKQEAVSCRPPTPTTSPDWPPRTERSLSNRWPGRRAHPAEAVAWRGSQGAA